MSIVPSSVSVRRISSALSAALALLQPGHPEPERIERFRWMLWRELLSQRDERLHRLAGRNSESLLDLFFAQLGAH